MKEVRECLELFEGMLRVGRLSVVAMVDKGEGLKAEARRINEEEIRELIDGFSLALDNAKSVGLKEEEYTGKYFQLFIEAQLGHPVHHLAGGMMEKAFRI